MIFPKQEITNILDFLRILIFWIFSDYFWNFQIFQKYQNVELTKSLFFYLGDCFFFPIKQLWEAQLQNPSHVYPRALWDRSAPTIRLREVLLVLAMRSASGEAENWRKYKENYKGNVKGIIKEMWREVSLHDLQENLPEALVASWAVLECSGTPNRSHYMTL